MKAWTRRCSPSAPYLRAGCRQRKKNHAQSLEGRVAELQEQVEVLQATAERRHTLLNRNHALKVCIGLLHDDLSTAALRSHCMLVKICSLWGQLETMAAPAWVRSSPSIVWLQ